jgi:2-phosphosulfolactate phosphatase
MTRSACVYLLPSLVDGHEFTAHSVVVVDILRATTTIVHALAAGAQAVIPLLDVAEARHTAQQLDTQTVLGGERGGKRIEGFHLGNSPTEYTTSAVSGKTVVFTTTNGTKAMQLCRGAERVFIGAFSCFSAICRELLQQDHVDILCAGTDGQITREDVLFAGAVVDDLVRSSPTPLELNDQADIAADAWRNARRDFSALKPLADCLRASRGGRNLLEIGHERDIEIAAQIDKFDFVAELDLTAWRIVRR